MTKKYACPWRAHIMKLFPSQILLLWGWPYFQFIFNGIQQKLLYNMCSSCSLHAVQLYTSLPTLASDLSMKQVVLQSEHFRFLFEDKGV
jgi:hypothetical protein